MSDLLRFDDDLRFVQRVLEGDPPQSDKDDAARMVRNIRTCIRQPAAQPEIVAWWDGGQQDGPNAPPSFIPASYRINAPHAFKNYKIALVAAPNLPKDQKEKL